jgi:hypothetical protein
MSWYAAHLIMVVRYKRGGQERFPVWENIVLIEASSVEEAFAKAEERAKQDEGDSRGTFTWAGEPAAWHFAGVRKLCTCVNPEERPGDGTEVSYLELELPSEAAVVELVEGKPVALLFEDR